MEIVKVKDAGLVENPHHVKVSKLYDTENAQVIHITLEPGESLKKTYHTRGCRFLRSGGKGHGGNR
jgi:hypothetical protein